jgi:allophanate hydrolase subunit 1
MHDVLVACDGPDVERVCAMHGISAERLVAMHTEPD